MPAAIQVENLSKRYQLGARANPTLKGALTQLGEWFRNPQSRNKPFIWALKNLSLEIRPGEVVGIIGRNGNGKSTLLKILSRITMPTSGRVRIHGSIASLLEVGTGFHPELTGRENIFLNGAILGMRRHEIRARLEEIVEFAEIGTFLDTPVKRYSSGMYVRLAFAVAAHLEPDVLLVDEVLAVGDGAFQKKCLGKIESVGNSQRTVLFVSHSLPAVRSICSRTILLNEGEIMVDGPTDTVLGVYNRLLQAPRNIAEEGAWWRLQQSTGTVRVRSLTAVDAMGAESWNFTQGQDVRLRISYDVLESVPSLGVYVALTSLQSGEVVTTIQKPVSGVAPKKGTSGSVEIFLPKIQLRPGEYSLTLVLGDSTCARRFDYLNHHQNLPWLNITSEEKDLLQMSGYFSIPAEVSAF